MSNIFASLEFIRRRIASAKLLSFMGWELRQLVNWRFATRFIDPKRRALGQVEWWASVIGNPSVNSLWGCGCSNNKGISLSIYTYSLFD
jgi:hypothetical protein